jgi:hypothetical protein
MSKTQKPEQEYSITTTMNPDQVIRLNSKRFTVYSKLFSMLSVTDRVYYRCLSGKSKRIEYRNSLVGGILLD